MAEFVVRTTNTLAHQTSQRYAHQPICIRYMVRMCDDHFNAQHYNFQLLTFAYIAATAAAAAAAVAILNTRNTTHTHLVNE